MRHSDFAHEQQTGRRPHNTAPTLSTVRAVFVIRSYDPQPAGSESGLGVTTYGTMRVLQRHGVHCEGWSVPGAAPLIARLEADNSLRPITHVIINTPNFALPVEIGEMARRWPTIDFVQLNHTGLAYLCIDDNGPQRIRETLHLQQALGNVRVAGNNPRFAWFGEAYGPKPLILPNLYDYETFVDPVTQRQIHDVVRVGSFGENRPWKNQQIAAMAALSIARRLGVRLELYVNADRWEQTWGFSRARAELLDDHASARLIAVPWSPWSKFRQIVRTMDICLHPSFDETFCCVVADGIAEGVPSVVTSAMEWAPPSWMARDPHDPASVAAVGLSLLHSRIAVVQEGRVALREFVDRGVRRWIDYFTA